ASNLRVVERTTENVNYYITGVATDIGGSSKMFNAASSFYWNANNNNMYVENNVYATDMIASSDIRLKTKVGTIDNALDKVCALDGFLYTWNDKAPSKDKELVHAGVSAQQVQEVLPEAVAENDDGYLGVKYDKLVPLLIEAIKELKAEVEELKSHK
ncbi:MAG: tail fiber domain-containing protein, partial [Candidatus Pacebacteria bacterium]|nr:tail fiber domain-containing protein [Candidatus Paceibacterota bacterium]